LAGYRTAVAEVGPIDPGLVAYGDFSQPSGEHAIRLLLDRRPDIDAVFAASDLMAMGVLRGLRRAGRRVPEDVAVIGFDDSQAARHTDPPLTTVRQPVEEMGARTARELITLIADPVAQPRSVVLRTDLVLRESA
jgi:DNA-binding LacI/PurR family transcriptional regulator